MIDDTLLEAEEKMEKAVAVAKEDLAAIRTGRATPAMFNKIVVDYYGAPTPVHQLASFNVPEARMAVIKPVRQERAAARSRRRSATPTSASTRPTTARSSGWSFPQLTEERRRTSSRSPSTRPRTPRSRSATSAATPRTSSTSSPRTARPARTTCAAPRRSSTNSPTSYVAQIDELLKHKEAELLEV